MNSEPPRTILKSESHAHVIGQRPVTALQTRCKYHAGQVTRLLGWSDLRILDGRLAATFDVSGNVPLSWFELLVMHVDGSGPRLSARVCRVTQGAGGCVSVLTDRLTSFRAPDRALPSSAVVRLRTQVATDTTPEQGHAIRSMNHRSPQRAPFSPNTALVRDYFAHPAVRRANRDRMAQIRKIYDNAYFDQTIGRVVFAFWGPGLVLSEHWLRTLTVIVRLEPSGTEHRAKVVELVQHTQEKSVYYVSASRLLPQLPITASFQQAQIVVTSACGNFSVNGIVTTEPPKHLALLATPKRSDS